MKKSLPVLLGSLFCGLAMSSLADTPFNVDSPSTIEKQHNFLLFNYASSSGGGKETETAPGVMYKYGINRDIEFRMTTGITTVEKLHKPRFGGLGDTDFQLKWRFAKETKKMPAFAIGYKIKIPTADANHALGSGAIDNSIWLTVGKTIKRWRVYANGGYSMLGSNKARDSAFYGVVVNYKLTERIVVGAQYYGTSPKADKTLDELAWGVGGTYKFAPDRTFYLGAGKSEHGFSNLNLYAGLGMTFK